MVNNMPFEYFFDYQSGQFDFIRIPRVMMTEEIFAPLSMQAKIMYGMLLDRMKLSYKNKWVDEENKVYIVYPINEMAQDMNISRRTVINCLGELMRLGLVDKKHIGAGRRNVLYIKKFVISSEK